MSESSPVTPAVLLRRAAYHGHTSLVRKLIEEAVDLNISDQWGRTPLTLASEQGHLDVVLALIAAKAWVDPHEDYDTYETPLIAAAESGQLRIVQALIAAGANPSIRGGTSQATAEFYARINGHRDVAEYLRKVMGIDTS